MLLGSWWWWVETCVSFANVSRRRRRLRCVHKSRKIEEINFFTVHSGLVNLSRETSSRRWFVTSWSDLGVASCLPSSWSFAGGAEEGALVMGLVVWERVKQIDFILLHWRYVIVQGRGGWGRCSGRNCLLYFRIPDDKWIEEDCRPMQCLSNKWELSGPILDWTKVGKLLNERCCFKEGFYRLYFLYVEFWVLSTFK